MKKYFQIVTSLTFQVFITWLLTTTANPFGPKLSLANLGYFVFFGFSCLCAIMSIICAVSFLGEEEKWREAVETKRANNQDIHKEYKFIKLASIFSMYSLINIGVVAMSGHFILALLGLVQIISPALSCKVFAKLVSTEERIVKEIFAKTELKAAIGRLTRMQQTP